MFTVTWWACRLCVFGPTLQQASTHYHIHYVSGTTHPTSVSKSYHTHYLSGTTNALRSASNFPSPQTEPRTVVVGCLLIPTLLSISWYTYWPLFSYLVFFKLVVRGRHTVACRRCGREAMASGIHWISMWMWPSINSLVLTDNCWCLGGIQRRSFTGNGPGINESARHWMQTFFFYSQNKTIRLLYVLPPYEKTIIHKQMGCDLLGRAVVYKHAEINHHPHKVWPT